MGKGNKEHLVGFSPELGRELRQYLRRREAALARAGKADCGYVFPNQNGGDGGPKGFQVVLRRYGDAADITRVRVSPHTFRHTFAVWFVRKGGSPFHLQRILGHTSLTMSRRYCELADVDFVARQQELSPIATMAIAEPGCRRVR